MHRLFFFQVSLQYNGEGRRTAVLDHLGNTVLSYEYDAQGRVRFVRDRENHQVEYRYSGDELTETLDVLGNSWRYSYQNGRMVSRTDAEGRVSRMQYNPTGRLIAEKDADEIGSSYEYDYDKTRKQFYIRQTDPDGKVTERWYDREGQLIRTAINQVDIDVMAEDSQLRTRTSSDRRGLKTVRHYDPFDNLTQVIHPDGSRVSYQYHLASSQISEEIDELGRITRYAYDPQGNLLQMTEAAGTAQQRISEYRYDAFGRRIEMERQGDAQTEAAITAYGYDDWGNLTSVTDPEGKITHFTYDLRGNLLSRTDPNGHITSFTYDAAGRRLSSKDALDQATTIVYDKVGNPLTLTDANDQITRYGYDIRNLRISVTDPLNNISRTEYFPTSGLTLANAPLGNAGVLGADIAFSYAGGGRLKASIDPLGNRSSLAYDSEGRLASQTDAAGNLTQMGYGDSAERGGGESGATRYPGLLNRIQYSTFLQTFDYDLRNRRVKTINHLENHREISHSEYDAVGNRTKSIDAEGRITEYRYDALDRLIEIIDPHNQHTLFQYDNRDNLIAITDPNNHTTRYQYDRNDRKTKEVRPGGQEIGYAYDDAGNLISTLDPDGRISENDYDAADRLIEQRHYAPGATDPERTVSYTYDANGNLKRWSDANQNADYQYDANNRKTEESTNYGPFSLNHQYAYDAAGNKASYTAPDGSVTHYHYDQDRLQRIALPDLGSINYTGYRWNRPSALSYHGGGSRTIDYDELLRPTRILASDPGGNPLLDYRYQYDLSGNIINRTTPDKRVDYAYDALQRLIGAVTSNGTSTAEGFDYDPNGNRIADLENPGSWSYDDNDRLLASPTASYLYDAAGNPVETTENANTTLQSYNAEGRLTRVETSTGTLIAEYRYDPLGRRISKTTPTETRYFHYTDEGLTGEYTATGTPIQQYGYQPDSTWTTDPLYTRTSQGYAFYQNDHLGTPQQLVKSNGAKVWEGEYKAFGETQLLVNTWNNPLRFPGQYFDQETGGYYNYFRTYDPSTGRYLESDPIGLAGGLNTYAYAGANPIKYVDPMGLDYWMEGADESEAGYGFHQSVCVGKPNGKRKCISFGRKPGQGDCWFDCEGHVYYDRSPAGRPVNNRYRYTDSATDRRIRIYFDSVVGRNSRYDILFGENCRNFSQTLFDHLVETYGGTRGTPPGQMPPEMPPEMP